MKKVLVTGGHGFIAGYVIEELERRKYLTSALVKHSEKNPILENSSVYYCDIRDDAGVYSAVEHCDGVIHLAGLLGTSENIRQAKIMNDVNVNGALNVLNACDNFKIPCVNIAVGNAGQKNTYSISKTTAEDYAFMYAQNFNTPVSVVRALNAYGPRQSWGKINKIIPTFINKALRGEDISVYGGKKNCSIMDMVYVGDVAKVLVDVLEKVSIGESQGELLEAGTGIGYPVYGIAEMIIRLTNSKSRIIETPMRAGEDERSVVIANNPYPIAYANLEDKLLETIEYYKNEI